MPESKKPLFERLFGKKSTPSAEPPAPSESPETPPEPSSSTAAESTETVESPLPATKQPTSGELLARRARRAVESLMENEALTDGLDDESASTMLAWASEKARQIAGATAELDDDQADQATSEQMHSLRRMMRAATRWASAGDAEESGQLDNLLEQAGAVMGSELPQSAQARDLLRQAGGDPAARIAALHKLFEGKFPHNIE